MSSFFNDSTVWFDLQNVYESGSDKGCPQHKLLNEILLIAKEILDDDTVA